MPPSFDLPPRIQKMPSNEVSAFSVESGIRRLGIVDEQRVAACGRFPPSGAARPGSCASPPQSRRRVESEAEKDGRSAAAAFWALCSPRSEAMPRRSAIAQALRAGDRPCRHARRRSAALFERAVTRAATETWDSGTESAGARAIARVHGSSTPMTARSRPPDQPLLDRRIVLHGPVPVEMIRRDIEQDADRRRERGRKIDLERRALDDVDSDPGPAARATGRPCRYCRPLHVAAGIAQDVCDRAPSSSTCRWCR